MQLQFCVFSENFAMLSALVITLRLYFSLSPKNLLINLKHLIRTKNAFFLDPIPSTSSFKEIHSLCCMESWSAQPDWSSLVEMSFFEDSTRWLLQEPLMFCLFLLFGVGRPTFDFGSYLLTTHCAQWICIQWTHHMNASYECLSCNGTCWPIFIVRCNECMSLSCNITLLTHWRPL